MVPFSPPPLLFLSGYRGHIGGRVEGIRGGSMGGGNSGGGS